MSNVSIELTPLNQASVVLGVLSGGDLANQKVYTSSTLPPGGVKDDVLTKRSSSDNDVGWEPAKIPWASTNW